ncbi:Fatty acid desaturase [Roseisalinus antarcticus]|uniref:Fatty acid desaturase n=1 Tax=Roseisalinus antarcticus TaxID=254357 RepID=A0A1Y5TEN1_9RHOB|nr:Fatty acid desaturase [Roseisalinus antarcticus]
MPRQLEGPIRASEYSVVGPRGEEARELGLAGADWYRTPVPRKQLKELMKRRDWPGVRDTMIWFGLLLLTGGMGVAFLDQPWLAIPLFAVYGVLYASAGEARWHECLHGTPFKNRKLNAILFEISSFLAMRNPVVSRWSHTRHHTDTYIVGLDPEQVYHRPPDIARQIIAFAGLIEFPTSLYDMLRHASGHLSDEEKVFVPEMERPLVQRTAIVWTLILAGVVIACFATGSVVPALLVGLPRIYGVWLIQALALTQHAGLLDDVLDHRLDSRTFHMNPVGRFIYWNMNYHIEHHMYPMVPYYNLPALHRAIAHDCPPAYPSVLATYREIVPTLLRQLKDPSYRVVRPLPAAAQTAA